MFAVAIIGTPTDRGLSYRTELRHPQDGPDQARLAKHAYLVIHNEHPKPFIWTKTADQILANVARFCQRTLEPR